MSYKIKSIIQNFDKRALAVVSMVLVLAIVAGTIFVVNQINEDEVGPTDSSAGLEDVIGYNWEKVTNVPGLRAYMKVMNGKLAVVTGDNTRTNHVSYLAGGSWHGPNRMETQPFGCKVMEGGTPLNISHLGGDAFGMRCLHYGRKPTGEETGSWQGGIGIFDLNGKRHNYVIARGDGRYEGADTFGLNSHGLHVMSITNIDITSFDGRKVIPQNSWGRILKTVPEGKFVGAGHVANDKLLYTENTFRDNSVLKIMDIPFPYSESIPRQPSFDVQGAPETVVEKFYQSTSKPHVVYVSGWKEYQGRADKPYAYLYAVNLNSATVFGNVMEYIDDPSAERINNFPFQPNRIVSMAELDNKLFISNYRFGEIENKGVAICNLNPDSGALETCDSFRPVGNADLGPEKYITALESYNGHIYAAGYDPNYGGIGVYKRVRVTQPQPQPQQQTPDQSDPDLPPRQDNNQQPEPTPDDSQQKAAEGTKTSRKLTQRILSESGLYARVCDTTTRMENTVSGNIDCSEHFEKLDVNSPNFSNLDEYLTDGAKLTGMSEATVTSESSGSNSELLVQKFVVNDGGQASRVISRHCTKNTYDEYLSTYGCGSNSSFNEDTTIRPGANGLPNGRLISISETSYISNNTENLVQRISVRIDGEYSLYRRVCENLSCTNVEFQQTEDKAGNEGIPADFTTTSFSEGTLYFSDEQLFTARYMDLRSQRSAFRYCNPTEQSRRPCSKGDYLIYENSVLKVGKIIDMAETGIVN